MGPSSSNNASNRDRIPPRGPPEQSDAFNIVPNTFLRDNFYFRSIFPVPFYTSQAAHYFRQITTAARCTIFLDPFGLKIYDPRMQITGPKHLCSLVTSCDGNFRDHTLRLSPRRGAILMGFPGHFVRWPTAVLLPLGRSSAKVACCTIWGLNQFNFCLTLSGWDTT